MATDLPPNADYVDREPQPSDGPDYHHDHAAWERRRVISTVFCNACFGTGGYPLPENKDGRRWWEIKLCRRCGGTGLAHNASFEAPCGD